MKKLILLGVLTLALPAQAAINATPVQTAYAGSSTQTITIGSGQGWSTPTSGHLLLFHWVVRENSSTSRSETLPTGFTAIQTYDPGNGCAGGGVAWKVSDGSETSFTYSAHGSDVVHSVSGVMQEYHENDLDLTSVDASGETEGCGSVTSKSSGTATNSTANALVIYGWRASNCNSWRTTGPTISGSSSFNDGDAASCPGSGGNSQAEVRVSAEVVSSAASQSETFTTTDSGSAAYGTVVIFAEAGDTTAPAYTSAPAASVTSTTVTVTATATDDTGPLTHRTGIYTGSCPSAANVAAGSGTGYVAGPFSHASVSSGAAATMTATGLSPATAYKACAFVQDSVATPNQSAVTTLSVTTAAAEDCITPDIVGAIVNAPAQGIHCSL